MKYGLNDRPGPLALMLYGAQWWVVTLPCVVIMGVILARLHFEDVGLQTFYMQKLFALMGAATVIQTLWGHRLPLVVGPASTLLVGIIAAQASGIAAVYTAIMAGGLLIFLLAASGLMARLRFFFTSRIIAVILILIAFTLTPTILNLVLPGPEHAAFHAAFALAAVFVLIICNTLLPGVWKSLTVIIGLAGGSAVYFAVMGLPGLPPFDSAATGGDLLLPGLEFHGGAFFAFVFCFFALLINELGSVESIGHMLGADDMEGRIKRGVGLQGIANMAAGGLGIIGPVDFSLSAGVISATGCASRFTLIPAGLGLAVCALFPGLIHLLACIPSPVMGALMLYLMSSQISSGLAMLVKGRGISDFNSGLTVGLPLMIGLIVAFAPAHLFEAFPASLRPIVGNGFVMGTLAVIVLEHVIFRSKDV